ncbi:MAG: WD40 repeat domain-containing protein [Pseudonocardiaceae bacterium]
MSDFPSLPEEALDRWLADQYRALVNDLTAALDLEAGLREVMIPARHADLVADLRDVLGLEAGLSAIVPATPDPAVEQAATEWNDQGRAPNRLWERGQLAAAVADTSAHLQTRALVTDHVDLNPTARDFLRASIRRDRFRRGRATAVLSVLLVFAVVAAGFAFTQQHAAEKQRDVALSRQAAGQATELRATNPALAAQLGLAAYRLVPTTEARSSLLSTVANLGATRLTGHTSTVTSVVFSPDGGTLATASDDTTARLWETNIDRVATRICNITPPITKSEWNQYLPDLPYRPPCP